MGFTVVPDGKIKLLWTCQAYDIGRFCTEVIRKQIEEAAWQAREAASQSLLKELEEEAAVKQQPTSNNKGSKKQMKKLRAAQTLKEKTQRCIILTYYGIGQTMR